MKRILPLLVYLISLPSAASLWAQDSASESETDVTVTFYLHAPDLSNDADVYITGNMPQLGNWHPGKVKMLSRPDHRWSFELRAPIGLEIEYKFTRGTWAVEAADTDGRPLKNLRTIAGKESIVRFEARHWTTPGKREVKAKVSAKVTGVVRYHRDVKAEAIVSRDILVWLPPGYESSNDRYGVLYMQDGQNLVDPGTSAFGVDWQVDETCTELIANQSIQPIIVVGIYNTPHRTGEYLPGETGTEYAKFVIETVKPMIDSRYRTKPSRDSTWVGGSSAGGTCAFRLAWEYPQVFSKAICMSPAFKRESDRPERSFDYVQAIRDSQRPDPRPFFYLDNGGVGLEKRLQPGIDQMLEALTEKGFVHGRDFVWHLDPEAEHNEAAWARRLPRALKWAVPSATR